ncbi:MULTISPECIES: ATP-binding protein [Paraburkholderia]|uniref:ATP-binding protein n=1 Tax=Paraburkholderia TaxID=1822464 RepID=UPI000F5447E6|nr:MULTISPECIES: ATP-binding protein [Paraburkholderia]MBB3002748.1 two-component system sensor histidine kinase BaeS [Paraburkholderia tropica]MBB6321895.1 two-component system sensor histidine kinase BaeS [Paraburkholderia tropica]QNB16403.1 HAMP domain-containing protein [Paraburkholderia tropica]RQM46670.1 HAMP domain-containing protein [Paraburkholderia bannensis]
MKASITSKLFLAILSACVLVAVAMGVAIRTSFEFGFIDFLQEQSAADQAALERELVAAYAEHGNWDFARAKYAQQGPFDGGPPPGEPPAQGGPGGPGGPDGPGAAGGPGGPGWPPPADFRGNASRDNRDNSDNRGAPPGGPDFDDHMRPHRPPFALYDAHQKLIVSSGPPAPPDAERRPLRFNGQIVGYVAVASPISLINQAEKRFKNRQLQATWIIVGFTALLSAAISIVLARTLLTPIKRIVTATHRLAGGDYATRVPANGSDELQMLANDFNRLAASLEKAEGDRRDFIADVSHELRTPLSVLRGELEAIEDGVRRPDAATIASLQAEVAMLSQLIDDLYELSLADIGQLSFETVPLDLVPIVEASCDAFRERLAAKQIALEFDPGPGHATLSGDPYRLTQLWKNLLENALRYTNAGGRVVVAISADDEHVHVDFQDSFPPVPAPLLPHLFDRFFRVDPSRSRQSGGAGLGLALCKRIVETHGGTIEASRSPIGGLRVLVQLPRLYTQ